MARGTTARPMAPVAVLVGALVFWSIFIARTAFTLDGRFSFSLFDDAMISMRYARNLASGHGLVWNLAGPRVEGYSNFLWTLYMALIHLLPLPAGMIPLVVVGSSLVLLILVVLLVERIAALVFDGSRVATTVACASVAFSYPLAFWSLRGMEIGLITFLLTLGTYLAIRLARAWSVAGAVTLAITCCAAVLTRTDGGIPAGILVLYAVFASDRGRRGFAALVLITPLVVTLAAQTAFREAYYGSALPNTYYLKLVGTTLGIRLGRGWHFAVARALGELAPLLVAAGMLHWVGRRRRLELALLVTVFGAQVAYSIYAGGDAWEEFGYINRYIVVGLPCLAILAAGGVAALVEGDDSETWRAQIGGLRGVAALLLGYSVVVLLIPALALMLSAHTHSYSRLLGGAAGTTLALLLFRNADRLVGAARLQLPRGLAVRTGVAAVAAAVLVLASNAALYVGWVRSNAELVNTDAYMARLGSRLRDATDPSASVAVVWAGAPPYWSGRTAIDLLGRSDPVIAREPRARDFYPGHDKWDYRYSIGRLRPDVVLQLWYHTDGDLAYIRSQGYDELPSGIWVRSDSTRVDRARLSVINVDR